MFATKKAFMMFNLKRENKVVAFVKRNPDLVLTLAGIAIGFVAPDVYADGLTGLQNELKTKLMTIAKLLKVLAGCVASIGAVWLIITIARGEPNYRLGVSLIVGGAMLAALGGFVKFFGGMSF
jgi:hypothetical protein